MMDCDTTGVEPDIALVKYKKLVGGGMIKIVNNTVPLALKRLGYEKEEIQRDRRAHRRATTRSRARRTCKAEHLPVFDCAFKPAKGTRSIHYAGHVKMMAAVQPFISGAISKTVNMPEETTVDEIEQAYIEGVEAGPQGDRHLPRRLQAEPAAVDQARGEQGERSAPRRRSRSRSAGASSPTSGGRSPTSSRSAATRATSRSASTRTASRARSSSRWPRRARRSRA